nr:ERF family protein [Aneurinibacillus sp. XH2]
MSKAQLYQKMLSVMAAVDYLQKDDTVAFGNTKYQAISEEKVTMTVRAELIKNKLIVFPIEQEHTREGTLSTVNVKYKIVDTETGESEILVSSGTGVDTQDKGVGKAMTYAFKYLFLRTFAIPTGEDPDKVSSAELDHKQQEQKKKDSQPPASLKAKYKLGKGSMDGFEDWVSDQTAKGRTFQQMEHMLQEALNKTTEKKGA